MSRRATAAEPVARRALLARLLAEEAERALTVLASHGQKRLWFAMRSAPGSPVYNCPLTIEVRGSIDPKALSSALSILVDRHEALRTTFKEEDGELYQIVAPRGHLPLERHDLAGDERVDLHRRRLDARAYAKRFARAAFNLSRGPLYRAALVSVSTEESFILLNAHHIVSDGWSQGTLLRELLAGYHASLRGTTPELPSLPLTYSDVAQWESKREVPSETLAYWRAALADVEPLRLPLDFARPPLATMEGARIPVALSAAACKHVRAIAHRENTSLFQVVLAAFQMVLSVCRAAHKGSGTSTPRRCPRR